MKDQNKYTAYTCKEGHALKLQRSGALECINCGWIIFGYLVKEGEYIPGCGCNCECK